MSRKLLLADDSITIQKVIGITFAHEDYQLTVVDNGDSALQKARLNRPDLVLADVFMPGKNGYELCAAIKGDPALAQVPVLLLSGTFEPFDEQKAREAGADSWISKPFESQALIERVEGLLNRPQPAVPVPPPVMQPAAAAAPTAVTAAPLQSPQPSWDEAPAMPADSGADTSDEQVADAWDDGSWELETPVAAGSVADPWKNLEDSPAGAPSEDDFSWEEPAMVASEMPNPQVAVAAPEAPGFQDDDDLWGAVSFGEKDLLGEFGVGAAPEGDLWAGTDEEAPPPAVAPQSVAPAIPIAITPPAPVVTAPPVAQPTAASGPAVMEWDEDEVIPLDDLEILDEEDLGDNFYSAATAAPPVLDAAAPEEDLYDPFAAEEDAGLALQQEAVAEISFEEEPVAEPFAMTDAWEAEETPLGETSPAVRELLATSLHEPDWSNEVSGGEFEAEEEDFLLNPAEVAMAAASQAPAVPSAGSPVAEEQLGVYLKEADIAALVEKVAGSVIERLAGSILERIAWEVVPDLAENLIKDEIRRIKEEVQ